MTDEVDRLLLLQGNIAARLIPRGRIKNLSEVEFSVSSQWGEDGIIEWLVGQINPVSTKFVEFGVESFHESNCRFLMQHRNWKGFVIDGDPGLISELRKKSYYWMYHLVSEAAFITAENIDRLITEAGFGGPIGLLSIDVDGNDFWMWQAVSSCDPDIVICEYNGTFGDRLPISIPYNPSFNRYAAHYSGEYFGASLPALRLLAARKGYTFVGTNSNGINAFFVKDTLAAPILALLSEQRAFPKLLRFGRDETGALFFHKRILDIFALISDLPVLNIETGVTLKLREISEPYSQEWLRQLD